MGNDPSIGKNVDNQVGTQPETINPFFRRVNYRNAERRRRILPSQDFSLRAGQCLKRSALFGAPSAKGEHHARPKEWIPRNDMILPISRVCVWET